MSTNPTVCIIGGKGRMGEWFRRFFEERGSKTLTIDTDSLDSLESALGDSDIVLVSVPIGKTVDVINWVSPKLTPDHLICDLTSIKGPAVEAMLVSRAEVLGLHPLFGPQVSSMEGQVMVTCKARPGKWTPRVEALFQSAGAKLKEANPHDHDRMMAVIQGLTHFNAISAAHALKSLGVSIEETLQYASPIYRLRMDMIGRVMAQDPTLYGEIALLNPETDRAIEAYASSCELLAKLIREGDLDGFRRYFMEGASQLGEFSKDALEESNFLIEALRSRKS